MRLKIWHTTEHDNYTVSEVIVPRRFKQLDGKSIQYSQRDIMNSIANSGLFINDTQFVPYHRISFIEILEDDKEVV